MKSFLKIALATIGILSGFPSCKKDEKPRQTISFANQPLDVVLNGIKGRWRAVYRNSEGFIYSKTRVADTTVGYYTWFYADRVAYSNKSGDSLAAGVIWARVADGSDSLYAFGLLGDPSPVFGPPYAVYGIVNDTLSVGTVPRIANYGGSTEYVRD